ncbi:hypothetical protein C6A85_07755, partial [Mycobacterium sp. ITM-2017-0098]
MHPNLDLHWDLSLAVPPSRLPLMWCLIAFILTFFVTRTIVRVTKNVRMNAIRHHISGNRDGGTARDKSQWRSRLGCTQ